MDNEHFDLTNEHIRSARATVQLLRVALANAAPAVLESLDRVVVDLNSAEGYLYNVALDMEHLDACGVE